MDRTRAAVRPTTWPSSRGLVTRPRRAPYGGPMDDSTTFDARKELWFGSIPPASQGAVRVQGGLLSLPSGA